MKGPRSCIVEVARPTEFNHALNLHRVRISYIVLTNPLAQRLSNGTSANPRLHKYDWSRPQGNQTLRQQSSRISAAIGSIMTWLQSWPNLNLDMASILTWPQSLSDLTLDLISNLTWSQSRPDLNLDLTLIFCRFFRTFCLDVWD